MIVASAIITLYAFGLYYLCVKAIDQLKEINSNFMTMIMEEEE
jgi:hypothetical protein